MSRNIKIPKAQKRLSLKELIEALGRFDFDKHDPLLFEEHFKQYVHEFNATAFRANASGKDAASKLLFLKIYAEGVFPLSSISNELQERLTKLTEQLNTFSPASQMFINALSMAIGLKSGFSGDISKSFEILNEAIDLRIFLSSGNALKGDMKDTFVEYFDDKFVNEIFVAFERKLEKSSFHYNESIIHQLIQIIDKANDFQTLLCLLKGFEMTMDDRAHQNSDPKYYHHLSQCFANASVKVLHKFHETSSPIDDFKSLQLIVTGLLRAGRINDIKPVVEKLERVVKKLPSKPAKALEEKNNATLFLDRCKVVLHEKNDEAFFQGLEEFFTTLPLPEVNTPFAALLIPRLANIYYYTGVDSKYRLLAKEIYTSIIRLARSLERFIPEECDGYPEDFNRGLGELPEKLVSVKGFFSELASIPFFSDYYDSEKMDPKIGRTRRQNALPALRMMSEIQRYYLDYFDNVLVQEGNRVNNDEYQFQALSVFYDLLNVEENYGQRFALCISDVNPTYKPAFNQYLFKAETFILQNLRYLKAASLVLDEIINPTAAPLTQKNVAIFRAAFKEAPKPMKDFEAERCAIVRETLENPKYDNSEVRFSEADSIKKVMAKTIASCEVFFILMDEKILEMADPETLAQRVKRKSKLDEEPKLKRLAPRIQKNAEKIRSILINVALIFCSTQRYALRSSLKDFADRSIRAHEFLLSPDVYKHLSKDQRDQVLGALSDDMNSMCDDYARQGSGLIDTGYIFINESISALLSKKVHWGISDRISEFEKRIEMLDPIFKKIKLLNKLAPSGLQSSFAWDQQEKRPQLEQLKYFYGELVRRRDLLEKVSTLYDQYVWTAENNQEDKEDSLNLGEYLQKILKGFPQSTDKRIVALRELEQRISDKDTFIRDHLEQFTQLAAGVLSPQEFINALLDVKNSASMRETVDKASKFYTSSQSSFGNKLTLTKGKLPAIPKLEEFVVSFSDQHDISVNPPLDLPSLSAPSAPKGPDLSSILSIFSSSTSVGATTPAQEVNSATGEEEQVDFFGTIDFSKFQ